MQQRYVYIVYRKRRSFTLIAKFWKATQSNYRIHCTIIILHQFNISLNNSTTTKIVTLINIFPRYCERFVVNQSKYVLNSYVFLFLLLSMQNNNKKYGFNLLKIFHFLSRNKKKAGQIQWSRNFAVMIIRWHSSPLAAAAELLVTIRAKFAPPPSI